jgi:hypothetical protein
MGIITLMGHLIRDHGDCRRIYELPTEVLEEIVLAPSSFPAVQLQRHVGNPDIWRGRHGERCR